MKICKNCGNQIEDDALVCPYCGCVSKNKHEENNTLSDQFAPAKKKRKTWLWILGWIFFFPVPLTVLIYRSEKLKKNVKIALLAVLWLFVIFSVLTNDSTDSEPVDTTPKSSENIKKLYFESEDAVDIKTGESKEVTSLQIDVKNKNKFDINDICFVSENPDVATLEFLTQEKYGPVKIHVAITALSSGETNVYVTSKDGEVKSSKIHVTVTDPIGVDSIELQNYRTDLCMSQSTTPNVSLLPLDAEDTKLLWSSSDESVATVSEDGTVTAVGGGTATISVSANSGASASFDVNVDGSKSLMNLSVSHPRQDDVNIGSEWSYDISVNGESVQSEMGVGVGETLSFYAQFTESDDIPDVGSATATHTVTQEDVVNGFEVSMGLYVTENAGRNSGKTAHFIVTYKFSPK